MALNKDGQALAAKAAPCHEGRWTRRINARFNFWLVLAYAVLLAVLLAHHEPWRDELHFWMSARDSQNLTQLWENRRYDGHPPLWSWLLFGANVLWTIAYDTYYAMVDREDDRRIGVKSTAILFGQYDLLMIALLQVTTLLTLLLVGWLQQLNGLFYASVLVAAALFVYQGVSARNRDRQACFQAFLANNWVGCVIFGGILLSTALT